LIWCASAVTPWPLYLETFVVKTKKPRKRLRFIQLDQDIGMSAGFCYFGHVHAAYFGDDVDQAQQHQTYFSSAIENRQRFFAMPPSIQQSLDKPHCNKARLQFLRTHNFIPSRNQQQCRCIEVCH
jgi:hypothetical protein